jgi:hypothetical protein
MLFSTVPLYADKAVVLYRGSALAKFVAKTTLIVKTKDAVFFVRRLFNGSTRSFTGF